MRRRRLLTLAGATAAGLTGCAGGDAPATTEDAPGSTAPESTTVPPTTAQAATDPSTTAQAATDPPTTQVTTAESWPSGPYADYPTTTVRVLGSGGEQRGSVTAAVADDGETRYLGLSDAESMPEDGGMLFVYGSVADRTFVMRRMDFGLDIVYADADGTITTVHSAPAPGPGEDGEAQEYPGRGQYVLEVNYEWTERRGVGVGDTIEFGP